MMKFNQSVKGLQTKVSYMETDVVAVKGKQKSLEEDCSHLKENAKFKSLSFRKLRTREKQISMNAVSKSFIWKPIVAGKT